MGRSRHQGGGGRRVAGAAAIALSACLLAAPAASAKVAEYSAPLPASDGSSWIDFKVKLKKNQQTKKFRPVGLKKVTVYFLEVDCPSGAPTQVGSFKYPDLIPVSGRKFSVSDTRFGTTFEASGKIPRNGPPQGKVRLAFDSGDPLSPGTCDSGRLSWTAKRLPAGTL